MINNNEKICQNCDYWKDFENRIYARIPFMDSNHYKDNIEIRLCKYNPPPQVQIDSSNIFTAYNFYCNAFIKREEDK